MDSTSAFFEIALNWMFTETACSIEAKVEISRSWLSGSIYMKLTGLNSSSFTYRPSLVITTPFKISLTGRMSCVLWMMR